MFINVFWHGERTTTRIGEKIKLPKWSGLLFFLWVVSTLIVVQRMAFLSTDTRHADHNDPRQAAVIRRAETIYTRLSGNRATVVHLESLDLTWRERRSKACSRFHRWDVVCVTGPERYTIRLQGNTPHTAWISWVERGRGLQTDSALGVSVVSSPKEARWLAASYLQKLGYDVPITIVPRAERIAVTIPEWRLTYDLSRISGYHHTLRLRIRISDGGLDYFYNSSMKRIPATRAERTEIRATASNCKSHE